MERSLVRAVALVSISLAGLVANGLGEARASGSSSPTFVGSVSGTSHQVSRREAGAHRAFGGLPLSQALTSTGALKPHVQGSFNARGFRMVLGRNGAPVFVKSTDTHSHLTPAVRVASSSRTNARRVLADAGTPDAQWSDRFGEAGFTGTSSVNAVAVNGANIYIGGSFARLSYNANVQLNNVAMWNGRGWYALGSGPSNGVNGPVSALAVTGSTLYVGGQFNSAGGAAANAIARWNGSVWSPLGNGMSDPTSGGTPVVYALALSGTTLYAAGNFDNAGSVASPSIASWNGAAWTSVGGGILQCGFFDLPNHCYSSPTDGQVNALAVSGTTVYAGGRFDFASGKEIIGLAVWNGTNWSGVGGNAVMNGTSAGWVYALTLSGSTLYVGGLFDHVGDTVTNKGVTVIGTPAASVASWNGTTWNALGSGAQYCSGCGSATVSTLAYWNGRLYMSGNFYGAGGDGTPHIAQWDGTNWSTVGPGLDSTPQVLVATTGGVIAAGGGFNKAGATAVLRSIGLWNGVAWIGYGLAPEFNLSALAASGHTLYAGGNITNAGSTPAQNIAQFDGTSWHSMSGGTNGKPSAIAISGSDVFVGGSFTQAGTVAATNIARWDGSSWHALGSGVDGAVHALLVYNGKLWVGGTFSHAGPNAANYVATWDLVAQTWAPVGGNLSYGYGGVYALAGVLAPNNHYVVIGGSFATVDTSNVTVNSILLFNTTAAITGPTDGYTFLGTAANPGVTVQLCCGSGSGAGAVDALLVDGINVYVGGSFDDAGTMATRSFARYDLGAGAWSSPGTIGGGSAGGSISAIVKVGSIYFVGGDFSTAGGTPANAVAQYDPAANTWTALGSGLGKGNSSELYTSGLAQSSDGLYVGGWFALAGNKPSENLALWSATAVVTPSITSFTPSSGITGSSVTITGTGFTSANAVRFNGLSAVITSDTPTQIIATVPNGATVGSISVSTPGGKAVSATNFTPTLSITSFTPTGGPSGTLLSIYGVGFNSSSTVKFNGVTATSVAHVSSTQLNARIPAGATAGHITVTNTTAPVGTVTSAGSYTMPPPTTPTITSFTPTSGITGSLVTINGTNLSGAAAVHFNGLSAVINSDTSTQITTTVPNGATAGSISVTTGTGTTASATNFTPTLSITSFTPTGGPSGTLLSIYGVGFNSSSTVRFNGVTATSVAHVSSTQLNARIPAGATAGHITVTNTTAPVGTVTSAGSYTTP